MNMNDLDIYACRGKEPNFDGIHPGVRDINSKFTGKWLLNKREYNKDHIVLRFIFVKNIVPTVTNSENTMFNLLLKLFVVVEITNLKGDHNYDVIYAIPEINESGFEHYVFSEYELYSFRTANKEETQLLFRLLNKRELRR